MSVLLITILCLIFLNFNIVDINIFMSYVLLFFCVFLARPTASVVLYSQMIGRGLRGPAIGGKENCLIVNVKDNFINLPSIDKMYKVFEDYWRQ